MLISPIEFIAFFLALQAVLGKLPFDIVEAESEIVEGPLIEQSGPNLALLKVGLLIRQLVFSILLVQIFVPWPLLKKAIRVVGFWKMLFAPCQYGPESRDHDWIPTGASMTRLL